MIRSFVKLVGLAVFALVLGIVLAINLKVAWLDAKTSAPSSVLPATRRADTLDRSASPIVTEAPVDTRERLSSATMPASGPISNSPYSVAMDYGSNIIRADSNYKDKLLLLHGDVTSIKRRSTDQADVEIEQRSKPDPPFRQLPVRCVFNRDQIENVARLWTGGETDIIGVCRGLIGCQVELRDCMLASSWSRRDQPGLGVSADEVMRRIAGYERCLYGFDRREGDMQAIFWPKVDDENDENEVETVAFLGSLDNPHTVQVGGIGVAVGLSQTMKLAVSATFKSDADRVCEWIDGTLLTLERRHNSSTEKQFGRLVVIARYQAFTFKNLSAKDYEAFQARPENQRLSLTITTASTPSNQTSSTSPGDGGR